MRRVYFLLCIGLLLTTACESPKSLQRYYVEKTEDVDFLVFNLPIQPERFFSDSLEDSAKQTLQSIGKMNMLLYRADPEKPQKIEQEISTVQTILAQDRYQELMTIQSDSRRGGILFEGRIDAIDEGIIWYTGAEDAIVILRLLADDLDPKALLLLLNKLDREKLDKNLQDQLGPMMDALEVRNTVQLQAI